jgi:hypothetical protein
MYKWVLFICRKGKEEEKVIRERKYAIQTAK